MQPISIHMTSHSTNQHPHDITLYQSGAFECKKCKRGTASSNKGQANSCPQCEPGSYSGPPQNTNDYMHVNLNCGISCANIIPWRSNYDAGGWTECRKCIPGTYSATRGCKYTPITCNMTSRSRLTIIYIFFLL